MGFFGMTLAYIAFTILHFFQFVLALVVCGLYGTDLDRARKAGKYADGKWVSEEPAPMAPFQISNTPHLVLDLHEPNMAQVEGEKT